MKFRTELQPSKSPFLLSPELPVVLTGSCFANNIGVKMRHSLWNAINPCGTLFNPSSIAHALDLMILSQNGDNDFIDSLFCVDGVYRSWLFDSRFTSQSREISLSEFKKRTAIINETLSLGKTLIITFGTAICYYHNELQYIVGNCHKQPEKLFMRKILSVDEIVSDWINLLNKLKLKIPGLRIIFTVSPVRHLRDGFEGNARSKARLLLAVEELCKVFPDLIYFPAFEIVNDDLRDYRFYAYDLVHPSEECIDYVWEKFVYTFLDEKGMVLLNQGHKIVKGMLHKLVPDASGEISTARLSCESKRIESLKREYLELKTSFPHLLRFDYPFDSDPGF